MKNVNSRYRKNETSDYLANVYRKWSEVDVNLLDHFLKKFKVHEAVVTR